MSAAAPARRRGPDWPFHVRQHRGLLVAIVSFVVMFWIYIANHPVGLTASVASTAANKGVLLALVAMAQTIPIITRGLDLSVGATFVLANCVASTLVTGGPGGIALGLAAVCLAGIACGALNGAIVVFGRLQPIIATIATGAIYLGLALSIRPTPGGDIDTDFADALTGSLPGGIPTSLLFLAAVVVVVWVPYRRSVLGRAAYAVGSSEQAAFMAGVPVRAARFLPYVLSGLFAALGGLFLTCVTYSGEASAAIAGTYTLNSIAAVVIGGTSLFGGTGGAIGSVFGAFVLRTIGDLLFVFDLDALFQPLFLGAVLLVAVSLDSLRLLRLRNRLEFFR